MTIPDLQLELLKICQRPTLGANLIDGVWYCSLADAEGDLGIGLGIGPDLATAIRAAIDDFRARAADRLESAVAP